MSTQRTLPIKGTDGATTEDQTGPNDLPVRKCCPFEDCQSMRIQPRQPEHPISSAAGEFQCKSCSRWFDEPDEREHKEEHPGPQSGLARLLLEAGKAGKRVDEIDDERLREALDG